MALNIYRPLGPLEAILTIEGVTPDGSALKVVEARDDHEMPYFLVNGAICEAFDARLALERMSSSITETWVAC